MSPGFVSFVVPALITALAAVAVAWWARRGSRQDSLERRVERLESMEIWRGLVKSLDDAHVLALESHIYNLLPPPPPTRPVYPPMPA